MPPRKAGSSATARHPFPGRCSTPGRKRCPRSGPTSWPRGGPGIHLEEAFGGEGYGIPELAVVLEELGFAAVPGPFLATTLAGAVLQAAGKEVASAFGPGLADGSLIGAVAIEGPITGEPADDGALRVSGTLRPVLSGHLANLVIADASGTWVVLTADEFDAQELDSVDQTRRVAEVTVSGAVVPREPSADRDLHATVRDALPPCCSRRTQLAVRSGACRPRLSTRRIGDSSADRSGSSRESKHRCANMVGRTELARAASVGRGSGHRR